MSLILILLLMLSLPASADVPLGATLSADKNSTTFRLFAPRATRVVLRIYGQPAGGRARELAMTRGADGAWSATADRTGAGAFYQFHVDGPKGPGEYFDFSRPLSDPYARANVGSAGRSIVVDPAFDWGKKRFRRPLQRDAIVYETHVKDFTFHPSAGIAAPAARGKFLGLADPRAIGHLKELGVNVVELMPVHEFDNAAAPKGHINHWGYMTTHFFAPESSYATAPHGEAVRELKTAIRTLHEAGIAVVLDVVYNHTAEGGADGPVYNLRGIDNKLYYRLDRDLKYFNGTGCGNEIASEHPAVRRLIVDSCKLWMSEYRVDGFRFDLGAGIDKQTMLAVRDALPRDTLLFAEPWTADWSRKFWTRDQMRGTRWAFWNDSFRDPAKRFVQGGAGEREHLKKAISGSGALFAATPAQSVNYVESHDNEALDDLLKHDVRKNHLAAVLVLTSQGVPLLHQGQELRKNKRGNHNSYDQDNELNWLDWRLKDRHRITFDFYRGLIALRRENGVFRRSACLDERSVTWLEPHHDRALGYLLRGRAGEASFLVLLNGDPHAPVTFDLPAPGRWDIVCDGDKAVATGRLGTVSGTSKVPASTGIILRAPVE